MFTLIYVDGWVIEESQLEPRQAQMLSSHPNLEDAVAAFRQAEAKPSTLSRRWGPGQLAIVSEGGVSQVGPWLSGKEVPGATASAPISVLYPGLMSAVAHHS